MKPTIVLIALALGAFVPLHAANASDEGQMPSLTTLSQSQDFSAAKKRKRVYVYNQYGYYHPTYWAFGAADPSWQSPELRRLRALNRCAFDLGYGRWENCN